MALTFDPAKRAKTLAERGLDFADTEEVLNGPVFEFVDTRLDYGEARITTIGLLRGCMVVVIWTERGADQHVISATRPTPVNKLDTRPVWIDPDDAPELDEEWFEKADLMIGRTIIRRGRPPGSAKTMVSLRLDSDLVAQWRATGPGWQTRINAALRKIGVG